jgi:hypothetical protein
MAVTETYVLLFETTASGSPVVRRHPLVKSGPPVSS